MEDSHAGREGFAGHLPIKKAEIGQLIAEVELPRIIIVKHQNNTAYPL